MRDGLRTTTQTSTLGHGHGTWAIHHAMHGQMCSGHNAMPTRIQISVHDRWPARWLLLTMTQRRHNATMTEACRPSRCRTMAWVSLQLPCRRLPDEHISCCRFGTAAALVRASEALSANEWTLARSHASSAVLPRATGACSGSHASYRCSSSVALCVLLHHLCKAQTRCRGQTNNAAYVHLQCSSAAHHF